MDHEEQRYAEEESAYMNAPTAEQREDHLYRMVESLSRQIASLRIALREEMRLRMEERAGVS